MKRLVIVTMFLCFFIIGIKHALVQAQLQTPTLGISGDKFTINGKQTFLLGVSYFDGRSWKTSDIDELARLKFNLIRIWVDWSSSSFFDINGNLIDSQGLLNLVREAGKRGMIVDVTILDTDLSFDKSKSESAVRSVVRLLKNEPNVFYDLVNEHDHAGDTFSHSEVTALANAVRSEDNNAIITVSSQGNHIIDDLTLQRSNVDAEIVSANLDIMTPHFTRTGDWYEKTDQRVNILKNYLSSIGKSVPVYLQEEARRGHSGLNPTKDQFLQAAREARDSGVAGWVFHTDAGFDLSTSTFFNNLDSVERATVDTLGNEIFGSTPTTTTTFLSSKKGDLNNDGKVDIIDLGIFLSSWGRIDRPPADINQDRRVDVIDLGILLSNWGK